MSPQECIAALDRALAADGEDIILRRVYINGSTQTFDDLTCRAKVRAVTVEEIAAGIKQTDLFIVISPTQINAAQWPSQAAGLLDPPFDQDPRLPLLNRDKVIARNRLCTVAFVDPKFVDGALVRINLRVTG